MHLLPCGQPIKLAPAAGPPTSHSVRAHEIVVTCDLVTEILHWIILSEHDDIFSFGVVPNSQKKKKIVAEVRAEVEEMFQCLLFSV